MVAGAVAGSATVLITNPIWVVNTRMTARKHGPTPSVGKQAQAPSTVGEIKALLAEGGPRAFFAGVIPALVLVINPILQYTLFEQLKNAVERRRRRAVTPTDAFWLGAVGKLVATGLTYPYVTVKSRMHVAPKDGSRSGSSGAVAALRRIVQEEGWQGLYKGIGPKLVQSVLTAAFLFAFKDALFNLAQTLLRNRRAQAKLRAR